MHNINCGVTGASDKTRVKFFRVLAIPQPESIKTHNVFGAPKHCVFCFFGFLGFFGSYELMR